MRCAYPAGQLIRSRLGALPQRVRPAPLRATRSSGPGLDALGPAADLLRAIAAAAAIAVATLAAGSATGAVTAHAAAVSSPTSQAAQSPQVSPETAPSGGLGVHVVRPGDTFYSLARRYQMSVEELAVRNAMSPTATLLPGRGLWVPLAQAANARAAEPARTAEGASEMSAASPPLSAVGIRSAEGAAAATGDARTIVVQPGDTLYAIADRFGTDIETLKAANGLPYDGSIRAGEVLIVQGGSVPQPVASAPIEGTGSAYGGSRTIDVIVTPGDTLSAIAERHGTTAANLARLNDISPDTLTAGQRLIVPRPGSGVVGSGGAKRIEVNVSEQRMYVWEGSQLIFNWPASTGMAGYGTRRGTFEVQSKIPNAWSSAWQLWMPNWLGIYWAGSSENGIHALPIINGTRIWGGVLGTPISYGCVVIGTDESRLLFNWAELGTQVEIHD